MSDRDEAIGRNLARFRGERTQQDIADAMRSLGYKWSQATVWAVEKGERPIRLTEAMDIARVLDVDLSDLFSNEQEGVFRVSLAEMAPASKRLEEAAKHYEHCQVLLAVSADLFPFADRYQAQIREWLNLPSGRIVERVSAGVRLVSGDLEFTKDPITGEIAGRGPWLDELVAAWQKDRQERTHGERPEEA